MSAADPRYYQLWAGRASSAANGTSASSASKTYRVDLDTPGGITYAPSELANHSAKRRLFIPREGARDEEYDYGFEVAQRMRSQSKLPSKSSTTEQPFAIGDDTEPEVKYGDMLPATVSGPTAAQVYAQSIEMKAHSDFQENKDNIPQDSHLKEKKSAEPPTGYASSLAPSDARSHLSTTTAADIARKQGVFQNPKMIRDDAAVVSTFRPPPSISGDSYHSVDPWNARKHYARRELEKLSEEERMKGLTRFEEYSGIGNAPTMEEVSSNAERDGASSSDAASVNTSKTAKTAMGGAMSLKVRDLFIPDPRPYKPLRLVRRTDPRQVLVLASGLALNAEEYQQLKAVQAAANSGAEKDTWKGEQAKALLASMGGDDASDLRAGLGLYYCPPDPTVGPGEISPRADTNFSKRMERVSFPHQTTHRRAALRSIIAALEYVKWEEEGFDKIVVGLGQEWIIRGITNDIHEWRNNDWRLTRQTILGQPGDSVPDQDLWDLLDQVVSQWEKSDCSVRFWQLSRDEMAPARVLAEQGALKDDQQPHIVKWTKKTKIFH